MQQNCALLITSGTLYHTQSETSPNTTQPKQPLSKFCSNKLALLCVRKQLLRIRYIFNFRKPVSTVSILWGQMGASDILKSWFSDKKSNILKIYHVRARLDSSSTAINWEGVCPRETIQNHIFFAWFGFHVHSDVEFVNVSQEQDF